MQADLMLTTAQIGMALAGFAGLATLLPFIPTELGFSEPNSWRFASAFYALAALLFFFHSLRRNRTTMGRSLIAGTVTAALRIVCMTECVVLGLNAAGVFSGIESGVYFAALFLHFLAAAFFFIRLLYGAFPRGDA